MRIIECVPNFSEGQNKETFQAIIEAIKKTEGVKFLNLEPDADYNRVVVTMAGNEKGIIDGAVNACKAASDLIDMRTHKGEHPRLGAIGHFWRTISVHQPRRLKSDVRSTEAN